MRFFLNFAVDKISADNDDPSFEWLKGLVKVLHSVEDCLSYRRYLLYVVTKFMPTFLL